MTKKHIVIFRTSGSYIDYNTYNCQEIGLARALVLQGYKVSLIMGGPKSRCLKLGSGENQIDIYYLTYKAVNQSLCIFSNWKRLLENLSPDVIQIHEFGMYMSYLVSRWAKLNNIRCVLIQGNYDTTQKPILKQLECMFNNTFGERILKNVDAIGCKTIAAQKYVYRYSHKPTVLTPIGLDNSKFDIENQISNVREEYGLLGKKILLYIGKLEQRRNPLFLLDIMKKMPNDYVLLLIGDGPLVGLINNRIKNESINNVLVLGKLKQDVLPDFYSAADLFLLASDYEIYGMVLLESMYFGCPVLSSMTAGAEVLIKNEIDGCIIQGELNIDKWVSKICSLFSTSGRLKEMGQKAKNKIKTELIWNIACKKFISVYE